MNRIIWIVMVALGILSGCQGTDYQPDVADVGEVEQATNTCNPISGVRRLTNLVTQFYWLASEGYATGHGHGSPNEYFSAAREPIVVNMNPGAAPPCRADGVCSCHWTNNQPVVGQHGSCYAIVRYYCSYTPPIGRTEWRSYDLGLTGDPRFPNWTGPIQADLFVNVDDGVPLSDNPSVVEELLGQFPLTTPGR